MRGQNKINMHFIISAVCLTIFSITFLLMPITNIISAGYARYISIAIGIVFWASGLIGYGALIYLYFTKKEGWRIRRRNYLFSNAITTAADVIFVLGILGTIAIWQSDMASAYLGYLSIFIVVFSWNIHWLFSRKYIKAARPYK